MSNYNRFQEKLKTQEERLEDRARKELSKKPIAKVSAKRMEESKEYEQIKKKLRKKLQRCQIAIANVCTGGPLEAHHPIGRSGSAFKKVIMCCRACHNYVHDHPSFAKRFGFSESRTGTPEKFKHLSKTNHT